MISIFMISMLACGEKETDTSTEDTGTEDTGTEDTGSEDTGTEDTGTEDTGTEEDTGAPEQEALDFIGSWEDNYGALIEVSDSEISDSYGSSYAIGEYSNEDMWVVAQNASTNAYNPDLWSKFEWHQGSDDLYYCQSAYDAPDAQTAQDTTADSSDLVSGCGGFGWSIIRPQLSITGTYTDNWEGSHVVNAFTWTSGEYVFAIHTTNEEEMWIVAQNASTNAYNPDLWSKFEWMYDADTMYYCQSAYDATDAQTAQDTTADRADIDTGCGGYGWSILTANE